MKFGLILLLAWPLITLGKRFGITHLPCGLVSGLLASLIVNVVFYSLGEPGTSVVLALVFFTPISILAGFFVSRRVYGLGRIFKDSQ